MNFWEQLPQPIIGLSPMDGVTDAAFRLMVAIHGKPDLSFTEFTSVGDLCRGPDQVLNAFLYHECERPVVAQLYGKDPELFYQAAHIVCELGFDGIDINMGCPSKNVASSGSGAGLIRTPDLAQQIMRATRRGIDDWAAGQHPSTAGVKVSRESFLREMNQARTGRPRVPLHPIPLSVKTRIGFNSDVIESWVALLLGEQPAAISIHGRTLEQMYRGEANWEAIERAAALARQTRTLLLGNGDLRSRADICHRIRETGVHGVLVGRGALGNPRFFGGNAKLRARIQCMQAERLPTDINQLTQDVQGEDLPARDRFALMLEHARRFESIFGTSRFPRMRKHLGWYCKGFPHAAAMRAKMVRTSSSQDVDRIVSAYLSSQPCEVYESPEPAETHL